MLTEKHMETLATYMNACKRKQVHDELAPCAPEEFLTQHIELTPESEQLLNNEDVQETKETKKEVYYLKADLRKGKTGDRIIRCRRYGNFVKVLIDDEYVSMPIGTFKIFCSKTPVPQQLDNPMVGKPYSWFVNTKR